MQRKLLLESKCGDGFSIKVQNTMQEPEGRGFLASHNLRRFCAAGAASALSAHLHPDYDGSQQQWQRAWPQGEGPGVVGSVVMGWQLDPIICQVFSSHLMVLRILWLCAPDVSFASEGTAVSFCPLWLIWAPCSSVCPCRCSRSVQGTGLGC